MKKDYIKPEMGLEISEMPFGLMGLSAPGEGISDGGEGSDDDDPTTKVRDENHDIWSGLW